MKKVLIVIIILLLCSITVTMYLKMKENNSTAIADDNVAVNSDSEVKKNEEINNILSDEKINEIKTAVTNNKSNDSSENYTDEEFMKAQQIQISYQQQGGVDMAACSAEGGSYTEMENINPLTWTTRDSSTWPNASNSVTAPSYNASTGICNI